MNTAYEPAPTRLGTCPTCSQPRDTGAPICFNCGRVDVWNAACLSLMVSAVSGVIVAVIALVGWGVVEAMLKAPGHP